jgi:hypothetical protein
MEQGHHLTDITVDSVATHELREFAKWGKFLSIIGFIFIGLIVLIGVFAGSMMGALGNLAGGSSEAMAGMGGAMAAIYIVIALIYFFPVLYLYQSSTKMKACVECK